MKVPTLSNAERSALEEMVTGGPKFALPLPVRGRLALYGLIDEGPKGWAITAAGRRALKERPTPAPGVAPSHELSEPERPSEADKRHYGKKTRDTSWIG